mmetsp:Transcript_3231/g.10114  ORF Transcript_3231/g.10114 Transcript_3231/m.10114 type:complete len:370 (-) Transcript_3231:1596-2705(-)
MDREARVGGGRPPWHPNAPHETRARVDRRAGVQSRADRGRRAHPFVRRAGPDPHRVGLGPPGRRARAATGALEPVVQRKVRRRPGAARRAGQGLTRRPRRPAVIQKTKSKAHRRATPVRGRAAVDLRGRRPREAVRGASDCAASPDDALRSRGDGDARRPPGAARLPLGAAARDLRDGVCSARRRDAPRRGRARRVVGGRRIHRRRQSAADQGQPRARGLRGVGGRAGLDRRRRPVRRICVSERRARGVRPRFELRRRRAAGHGVLHAVPVRGAVPGNRWMPDAHHTLYVRRAMLDVGHTCMRGRRGAVARGSRRCLHGQVLFAAGRTHLYGAAGVLARAGRRRGGASWRPLDRVGSSQGHHISSCVLA